jgi:hypothetical protein
MTSEQNEKMLFEITDDYYIIESWALELVLGVLLLLALTCFELQIDNAFFAVLAMPIAVYAVAKSLFKTYEFYVHKDKKIQFYPSKIVRTHDRRVYSNEINGNAYKLSFFSLTMHGSKNTFKVIDSSFKSIIHFVLLLPFTIVFNTIMNLVAMIYFKQMKIYHPIKFLNDDKLIFILFSNSKNLNDDYFKEKLNLNINTLKPTILLPATWLFNHK